MSLLDKARKRLANINEKKFENSTEFWNPHTINEGDENDKGDRVRMICPPYLDKPDMEPWVASQTYTIVGGKKDMFTHAPSFFDREDPVKEYREKLFAKGTPEAVKKAKSLRARDVYYALVVDMNAPEKGVQVWTFGNMIMEALCNKLLDEDYHVFWDLDKGHDIKIKRTGEQLNTKYVIDLAPKPTDLMQSIKQAMGEDFETLKLERDDYLAQAAKIDLAAFIKVETPATLYKMLQGEYDADEAKKAREERDAVEGRPQPLFVARENEVTEELVEHRRAAEKEDLSNDPLFGPGPGEAKDEIPFDPDPPKDDAPKGDARVGKQFKFEVELDDEGASTDWMEGECTQVIEDSGETFLVVVVTDKDGATEEYEILAENAQEVAAKKKAARRVTAKPAKTEEQTSVMDRIRKIREDS